MSYFIIGVYKVITTIYLFILQKSTESPSRDGFVTRPGLRPTDGLGSLLGGEGGPTVGRPSPGLTHTQGCTVQMTLKHTGLEAQIAVLGVKPRSPWRHTPPFPIPRCAGHSPSLVLEAWPLRADPLRPLQVITRSGPGSGSRSGAKVQPV